MYIQNIENFRKDILIPGNHRGENILYAKNGPLEFQKNKESLKYKDITSENQLLDQVSPIVDVRQIFLQKDYIFSNFTYNKFTLRPYGLLFKLAIIKDKKISEQEFIIQQKSIFKNFHTAEFKKNNILITENLNLADIHHYYINAYLNTANYLLNQYHDKKAAQEFYLKALSL